MEKGLKGNVYMCITEPHCWTAEMNTMLDINYTSIKNTKKDGQFWYVYLPHLKTVKKKILFHLFWAFLGQRRVSRAQEDVSWKLRMQPPHISEFLHIFVASFTEESLPGCFFHPLCSPHWGLQEENSSTQSESEQNSQGARFSNPGG